MNYEECINWLFNQLPMYQRQGKAAYKANLNNTIAFAEYLNYPEKKFKSIHVGGTNGKGSISHNLASIFQEAGYKVGLYTSPHLIDFRERIKINGQLIPQQNVIQFVENNREFMQKQELSFFEMTVGMAFSYFAEQKVDIAIIEVGLGGRLDSTNIIEPELSVITNISFDHTAFLGNTLAKIAGEKAGIIKKNTPVVIGEFNSETFSVFKAKAEIENAQLHLVNEKEAIPKDLNLVKFQQKNLRTLQTAIDLLKTKFNISKNNIEKGIANVRENTGLLGRWQIIQQNPKVICDTGHNEAGITLIAEELAKENFIKLHVVFGMVNDKDVNRSLQLLPKSANYYFCEPKIPRAQSHLKLLSEGQQIGLNCKSFRSVEEAYQNACTATTKQDLIFVGGSTFVVADFLQYLKREDL